MNEVMIEFASVECEDPLVIEDTKPLACRCCLATERPLRPLDRSQASLYHQLTGTTVSPSDIYPKFLCSYCRALLIKFSCFRRKCLSAQETLCYLHSGSIPITKELLNSGVAGSPYPQFTISITQLISLDSKEQLANDSSSNDLSENKVFYDFHAFQGESLTITDNFDIISPKIEKNEEIITVTDADTVSEDDASDMPDCLVGLNTDIYTKDSKKPFKDELIEATKGKIQKKINDRPEAAYSKKVRADNAKVKGHQKVKLINTSRAKTQTKASKAGQNIKRLSSDKLASIIEETKIILKNYKVKNSTNKEKCINREVNQETTPKLQASSSQENSKEVVMVSDDSELSDGKKGGNDKAKKTSSKPSFSIKEMQELISKIKADNEKRNKKTVEKSLREQRNDMLKQSFSRRYNVTIISLSKEEQIKQFMARKDAPRYKKSKYKCELCYTGFPFEYRYKIHMDEHQPKVGHQDFICDVCNNTRYARKNRHRHDHSLNYKCNECGFISIAKQTAVTHYNTHIGKTYDCKICGKVFNRPTSVFGHMHLSHGGTEECPICSLKFIGRGGLRSHMSLSHKEAVGAVCGTCGVQFHSHDALRRHLPQDGIGSCDHTHRPCAACGEGFPTEELLRQHKQEHHWNDKFTCERCGKVYDDIGKYKKHVYTKHIYEKNHPNQMKPRLEQNLMCEVCGVVKKSRILLACHIRSHTRPFQCDYCQHRFSSKANLETHIYSHLAIPTTSKKEYLCSYCAKTFLHYSNRQRHEQLVHLKTRRFRCDQCGNTYQEKFGLQTHINTKHLGMPWPKRIRNQRQRKK